MVSSTTRTPAQGSTQAQRATSSRSSASSSSSSSSAPSASHRQPSRMVHHPMATTSRSLRGAAAYYSCSMIFTKFEKKTNEVKHAEAHRQFYGDGNKVKGAIHMLVEGSGPFATLYEQEEDFRGVRKVVKSTVAGKDN
ncbi:hypothetical protein THAOC_20994, partial [Thalassiosira oceanica]